MTPWSRTNTVSEPFKSLTFADLSFSYGDGDDKVPAIHDISLTVEAGEFVTIVGPSGCGKSTLFNLASGLVGATQGALLVNGRELEGVNPYTAYMFQRDALLDWRSVVSNATLGREFLGDKKRKVAAEVEASLAEFGLEGFQDRRPYELSGGMRQRVALMRTYTTERPLLLLDEPFGALDALTRLRMQEFLLRRWDADHRTVIFITHDVDEALLLGDRVIVLSDRPATISEEIPLTFPRPRLIEDLMVDPTYIDIRSRVMLMLHSPASRIEETA